MRLAACLCAIALLSAPPALGAEETNPLAEALAQAAVDVENGRCDQAEPVLDATLSRASRALKENGQMWVLTLKAQCRLFAQDMKGALDLAKRITALPAAGAEQWDMLFNVAAWGNERLEALTAFETLAQRWPDAVAAMETRNLTLFYADIDKADDDIVRRRFLAALDRIDYTPNDPFTSAEYLWKNYAKLLLAQGDSANAARVMSRIGSTYTLTMIKLDADFAALVAADPARFDLRAAAERELAANQAKHAAHPDRIAGVTSVATSLRMLGRFDEALRLTGDTIAQLRASPPGAPAFSDLEDSENWLYDNHARTLAALDRRNEQLTLLKQAMQIDEQGGANVSQAVNYAAALLEAGRYADAIAALKVFDKEDRPASGYGMMQVVTIRACAYTQLKREKEARAAFAYLAEHENDAPGAYAEASLCRNDLDSAATIYIRRLADPDERQTALFELSDLQPTPLTAFQALMRARLEAMRARPDVQAAIAKAGHVEELPLYALY